MFIAESVVMSHLIPGRSIKLARACLALMCGLAAWSGLADGVRAQGNSLSRGMPGSAELGRFGLEIAWTGQSVINPSRDKVEHFTLDEEVVFSLGTNGVLSAFDAETGRRLWAQRLGSHDEPGFPPATNEEIVIVTVGSKLFGIDKLSGDIAWQVRLPGPASTGPSIDEQNVYVGTLDGSIYAIGLRKIRELYLEQRLPDWSHEAVLWRYQAALEVTSSPIPTPGAVNFASRDGSFYSVAIERRKLNFQFETDAPIVAPISLVGQTMFIASEDFTFYAINVNNGTVLWEYVTGLPIRKGPVALGSSLYLSPDRGGLFSLDVGTGERKWWQPKLKEFVALMGNTVVARDLNDDLALLEAESGRLIGRLPASYYQVHAVNNRSDRIYLSTTRGQILALRETGRNYPLFHRYPERRPILPEIAPEEEPAMDEAATAPANE